MSKAVLWLAGVRGRLEAEGAPLPSQHLPHRRPSGQRVWPPRHQRRRHQQHHQERTFTHGQCPAPQCHRSLPVMTARVWWTSLLTHESPNTLHVVDHYSLLH